ncbi:MAG TPA: DEAD/DEAH box helicase [Polyangiaceae bacterium]|nr:DEAD/DEAH box helicase [Polyangiaceae bacterium]
MYSETVVPFIQKRGASGKWTKGRKLAIKHLMGDSKTLRELPPEDQSVARYAHQARYLSMGYPRTEEWMKPDAWLALIGHPRVFAGEEETPREVVRGVPKLTVHVHDRSVVVETQPAGLGGAVSVKQIGGQFVVFELEKKAREVVEALGPRFEVPKEGKCRLLEVVKKLAPIVVVESSERIDAKTVPADPSPHMRLLPSRGGLAVTLLTRPLGSRGVFVTPGRGAPTLLSEVEGESVQAERDLEREIRLADELIDQIQVLTGSETGEYRFHVGDPESCLELLAKLRDVGDALEIHWPQGTPLTLRARLTRRALRGKLTKRGNLFELTGFVQVDGDVSLQLEQVIELVAAHPGRFVQLASGEYVELEQELREVLEGMAAARDSEAKPGKTLQIQSSAITLLDQLTREGSSVALDKSATAWRQRFDQVFASTPRVPKSFNGQLRDYQVEGFRWLARLCDLELGACLADDMGLGKTVQLIALLLHRVASGPALIVAPTSVCENWRRELQRFGPSLRVRAYAGTGRGELLSELGPRDVAVASYGLLQQDAEALSAIEWGTAVLDEAQLIKNADTLRAKAAFRLNAKARVIATGTPVENHVADLVSLFHFLNPRLLGNPKVLSTAPSAGSRGPRRLLKPFILRRTKSQVLEDLPPVTTIQHDVVMTPGEAALYNRVREEALAKLAHSGPSGKARIQVFAELMRLRRLCCHPGLVAPEVNLTSSKLESFLELAEELVAARHKILVFSQFTDVLALVKPLLKEKGIAFQYLDGSTPAARRTEAVDAFQAGEGDVFLISLRAGGFGLNLTAADYVIHLDPWWNPAVESQASDRAHRIGQSRPVTIYRLVTVDTIESRIVQLHAEKRELADALLSETEHTAKLTAAELRGLLEQS